VAAISSADATAAMCVSISPVLGFRTGRILASSVSMLPLAALVKERATACKLLDAPASAPISARLETPHASVLVNSSAA